MDSEIETKQDAYTLRHQYGNFYSDDNLFLYYRDPKSGIFAIERTAPPKKSKVKRILEIIKEK